MDTENPQQPTSPDPTQMHVAALINGAAALGETQVNTEIAGAKVTIHVPPDQGFETAVNPDRFSRLIRPCGHAKKPAFLNN